MPKLWTDTIDAHRREVTNAILDSAAALANEGLLTVTMSRIAEQAGIGRATLYKYFSDVEAVLLAWHEREVASHLQQLSEAREHGKDPARRLDAVLGAYALIVHESRSHHDNELAALLHRHDHVIRAEQELRAMFRDLLAEAASSGDVRRDVAPDELAAYCLHALTAAGSLQSAAAVRRLVAVTLAGTRPDET